MPVDILSACRYHIFIMPSERFQRRIDRILDQIEDAADRRDWAAVRQGALDLLIFDPENADAINFLAAAQRALDQEAVSPDVPDVSPATTVSQSTEPTSFANGRYQVKRFLGEGGKKKVSWPTTQRWTGT